MPNPWDRGSARALASLGFPALASTSAGFAFSRGLPDTPTALSLDEVLDHLADLVGATDLPVNADFQAGYAPDADGVAANVTRAIGTGVAGLSIEDASGQPGAPLFDLGEATERIRAARSAIDDSGHRRGADRPGRIVPGGHRRTAGRRARTPGRVRRAGADVLFAPGLRTLEDIRVVVEAAGTTPVNVLIGWAGGPSVAELADAGVRRVSVGSALARAAWGAFLAAADALGEQLRAGRRRPLRSPQPALRPVEAARRGLAVSSGGDPQVRRCPIALPAKAQDGLSTGGPRESSGSGGRRR